jgi:hypothetical protein
VLQWSHCVWSSKAYDWKWHESGKYAPFLIPRFIIRKLSLSGK